MFSVNTYFCLMKIINDIFFYNKFYFFDSYKQIKISLLFILKSKNIF